MAPQSMPGKSSRPYRSQLRQQQAEQTRSRILEAAAELFAADGYVRTTLAKIAAAAGVSPETVQGHGPKAAIFIAAIEHAVFGVAGEADLLNLDIGRRILAIDDYAEALDFAVATQTDLHARSAILTPALFTGAGSDPELDQYLTNFVAGINSQIRRVLGVYRDRGWLRADVPFDELVQTAAVFGGIETYLRLVLRERWSPDAYQVWLRRMIEETILVAPQSN